MRGFAAAKKDAGPGIIRNLLHIWGMMLIVGILFFGGLLVGMLFFVAIMNAGDAVFGGKSFTDFMTVYVLPLFAIAGFIALMIVLYWRSRSDSRGT